MATIKNITLYKSSKHILPPDRENRTWRSNKKIRGGFNWDLDPFSNPLDKVSKSVKHKEDHKKYYKPRKSNG